ncbi:MAG: hypothetical protein KF912_03760 [Phycisphaeraceae bacterium]|nr:hypothetical protein [Phycisphaeraceae bacterium]MBX3366413.1 hypothetical protein [Phycisphaeraceae bacterium]
MSPNPKKPKPFDADRAMAIFNDGHSIQAAVARATRAASESHTPRPCPTCGTVQPSGANHPAK